MVVRKEDVESCCAQSVGMFVLHLTEVTSLRFGVWLHFQPQDRHLAELPWLPVPFEPDSRLLQFVLEACADEVTESIDDFSNH